MALGNRVFPPLRGSKHTLPNIPLRHNLAMVAYFPHLYFMASTFLFSLNF